MNNSFICLDLGASNTRYCEDNGIIHWLPNNISVIDQNTETNLDAWGDDNVEERIRSNLDITIEKVSGTSDYFPVRVLVGKMAERYRAVAERPNSMMHKHKQRVNYISAIAATAVSRLNVVMSGGKVESDALYMYVALPPVEIDIAKGYMSEQLVGEYKVTFNKLDSLTVNFRVLGVKCMEESYSALTTFFFENGKLRPNAVKYARGYVLSLDVGASTTDIVAVKDMKFLERTGKTLKIGGNSVTDTVIEEVQKRDGYELNHEDAELAVAEGRVRHGMAFSDISEIVINAKKAFASSIIASLQTYFINIKIPIQSFSAIVVSGGGSMKGEYTDESGQLVETSKPISDYITEQIQSICNTVAVEYIDDAPRLANVKGLFTKAIYDKKKRESVAAQNLMN